MEIVTVLDSNFDSRHTCPRLWKKGRGKRKREEDAELPGSDTVRLFNKEEGRKKGRGKRKERKILSDWVAALLHF